MSVSRPPDRHDAGTAAAQVADFELHGMLGANVHARDSVLVGMLPPRSGGGAAPEALAARMAAIGLANAADPQPPLAFPRQIEWVAAAVREALDRDPYRAEVAAPPADAFVLPFEPMVLSQRIAQIAFAVAADRPLDAVRTMRSELVAEAERMWPHMHVAALAKECRRRRLPWRRMPWSRVLNQIGEGYRQLRIDMTVTSRTGYIATSIAGSKAEASRLLAHSGIPVPRQRHARSVEEAWAAAQAVGMPVVVKPRHGREGTGVTVGISTREEVEEAARLAFALDKATVVETQVFGSDHRALVVNGEIISLVRRISPTVTGDGRSTIRELVEAENRNPDRAGAHGKALLDRIDIDRELERRIGAEGYRLDSVPAAGTIVPLRYTGNLSRGATAVDVTDIAHPVNRAMLIRAADLIGLDVAGIDFITTDITRPYHETGGAICEVNFRVGTRNHLVAERGTQRSVVRDFLDHIYPMAHDGRVPVVLVAAGDGDAIIRAMARDAGFGPSHCVGLVGSDWIGLDQKRLDVRKLTGWHAHQLLTEDPAVACVIMAIDAAEVVSGGLGVGTADLALLAPGWANGHAAAEAVVRSACREVVEAREDDMPALFASRVGALRPS